MTNDDMTPRQPDEGEPLEDVLGDEIDRVDQAVARITDAEVNERLRKALSRAGYAGQWPRPIESSVIADLICQKGPAMVPDHPAVADLLATARANAKLSGQRLRRADEVLAAARQQAEEIVTAAREEAAAALDEALKEAAKIVRAARERAEQIIDDARDEAKLVMTPTSNPQPNRERRGMVITFDAPGGRRGYHGCGISAEDTVAAASGEVVFVVLNLGEEQDQRPHWHTLIEEPRNYKPVRRELAVITRTDELAETYPSRHWRAGSGPASASEGLPYVLEVILRRVLGQEPLWDTGGREDRGNSVQIFGPAEFFRMNGSGPAGRVPRW